jgi:hypothetical protein
MRGLEILANQVAAGCMHAKFPGLEPRRGQRFLTQETALADWSRVVADNGFHRRLPQWPCESLRLVCARLNNRAAQDRIKQRALSLVGEQKTKPRMDDRIFSRAAYTIRRKPAMMVSATSVPMFRLPKTRSYTWST